MKITRFIVINMLVGLALLVAACGSPATPAPVVVPPTEAPPATSAPVAGTAVNIGKNDKLGSFLVDDKGMTLYLFTKDTPNTSVCYDKCATAWPPLLTSGAPIAGSGADASKLGTTKRTDGTEQVTYNGWPLYYFAKDKAAGDVVGQDVGKVWFVVSPAGDKVESASATVNIGKNDKLGSFLVDSKGMTLYLFTKDTANTPSVCYDKCATAWPPLLVTGAPVAGDGIDASKLGTSTRTDNTVQVTYNGWPLYYFAKDVAAGDVNGQDLGNVWFVVSAAGDVVQSPDAATVNIGKNDKLGSFLVDGKGMTLYLYTKDTPNTSVCYDKCATAWPPLLVTGAPIGGKDVDASKLGTTKRTDGTEQVTYNGWPLYYFAKDVAAGNVTGQTVGTVWFVVSPTGDKITTAP